MNSTAVMSGKRAVDDDDVGHVGRAHADSVEAGGGLDDQKSGPPRMRFATFRMTAESSTNMQRFICRSLRDARWSRKHCGIVGATIGRSE